MSANRLAVVAAGVAAIVAAVVILLATGGTDDPDVPGADASQDVVVGEGTNPPTEVAIADIISTEVTPSGSALVFEARMAGSLPQELPDGSLEFRWEILNNGAVVWLVAAEIGDGSRASVLNQATGFGASTIDDTLPGSVTVSQDSLRVELRTEELEDWPETFDWVLKSTLDGDRSDGASAIATDSAPGQGTSRYEE